jgi:4-aminobutyrate aminotransferase-like enzyme
LKVIEEEKLQENSKIVGEYFLDELKKLQKEFEIIGDVRGCGLFIGIEFVKDKVSLGEHTSFINIHKNLQ